MNKKYKNMTYEEKKEVWNKLYKTPMVKFEDIKIGETYHMPMVLGRPAKNIVITSKTENSISCKEETQKNCFSYTTYFKDNILVKALVPLKLKKKTIIK